jgi:hypothetical protein
MTKKHKIKQAIKLLQSLKGQKAQCDFIGMRYEFDEQTLSVNPKVDGTFTITIKGRLEYSKLEKL